MNITIPESECKKALHLSSPINLPLRMTTILGLKFEEFTMIASDRCVTYHNKLIPELRKSSMDIADVHMQIASQWASKYLHMDSVDQEKIVHSPQKRTAVTYSGYITELSEQSSGFLIDPLEYLATNPEILGVLRILKGETYLPPSYDENLKESVSALSALKLNFIRERTSKLSFDSASDIPEANYILMHGKQGKVPNLYEVNSWGKVFGPNVFLFEGSGSDIAAEIILNKHKIIWDCSPADGIPIFSTAEAIDMVEDAIRVSEEYGVGCGGFSYVIYGRNGLIGEGKRMFEGNKKPDLENILVSELEEITDLITDLKAKYDFLKELEPNIKSLNEKLQETKE